MKSLLARTGLPKAVGLTVDGDKVILSQVVSTPFGPIETTRRTEVAQPDQLPSVLQRQLQALAGRNRLRRVPVAIGLPIGGTYFTTRPIQNPRSEVSPHVLLREALRSPNVSVNEMAVDVIKAQPDKRPVASIAAYGKKELSGLLEALKACGVRPFRAEPAPCALLRAAARRHRSPRNHKVVLRLLLGDTSALAVLVVGGLPIVWRLSNLARGDESSAILSLARSVMAVSRDCGIESSLDVVMVHGRSDLRRLLDMDWMQDQLGVPLQWFPEPPLDSSQVAFGLALGCFSRDEQAFDLSHSLKPRASLWQMLPWREAILQAALLLCMAMFLADRYRALNDSSTAIHTQNAQHLWMESLEEPQLEKERNDLAQKVAAVRRFLDSRITWTTHQRALAACMPDNMFLTSFHGVSELGAGKKQAGKPKRSLVLRGAVVLPEDGLMPKEIDRFLDTLRAHPTLTRDFPIVELADLKHLESTDEGAALACFTVVCLPKPGGGTAN